MDGCIRPKHTSLTLFINFFNSVASILHTLWPRFTLKLAKIKVSTSCCWSCGFLRFVKICIWAFELKILYHYFKYSRTSKCQARFPWVPWSCWHCSEGREWPVQQKCQNSSWQIAISYSAQVHLLVLSKSLSLLSYFIISFIPLMNSELRPN